MKAPEVGRTSDTQARVVADCHLCSAALRPQPAGRQQLPRPKWYHHQPPRPGNATSRPSGKACGRQQRVRAVVSNACPSFWSTAAGSVTICAAACWTSMRLTIVAPSLVMITSPVADTIYSNTRLAYEMSILPNCATRPPHHLVHALGAETGPHSVGDRPSSCDVALPNRPATSLLLFALHEKP